MERNHIEGKMDKVVMLFLLILMPVSGCKKMEQTHQHQPPVQNAIVQSPGKIDVLKNLLEKNPENVGGWITLGNMMMDSSNFKDAIDAYQKALALTPNNVDVRVDMGTCYRGTGKPLQAIEEYRKAIKINPSHLNAHKNLGIVLAFDLKNNTEAIKEFETCLKLAPDSPDTGQLRQLIAELKSGSIKK
jgi:cytochrome c-type biogenesis protein CcmH/NrfG